MSEEEWRPVVGFEGRYEVSNLGRVRSLSYRALDKLGRLRNHKGRVLLAHPNSGGYPHVVLGHGNTRTVHRLVLDAFVGPRPPGLEGCHNNGVRDDNRLSNLRWDTKSANCLDRTKHGTDPQAKQTRCIHGHAFDAENTWLEHNGSRHCRTCARERAYARYQLLRGAS